MARRGSLKSVVTTIKRTPKTRKKNVASLVSSAQLEALATSITTAQIVTAPIITLYEPHMLTCEEFHSYLKGYGDLEQVCYLRNVMRRKFAQMMNVAEPYWSGRNFKSFHRALVAEAVQNGKEIAASVKSEYPDLF